MIWSWILKMPADANSYALLRFVLAALTGFVVSLTVGARVIRLFRRRGWVEDTRQPDHAALDAIQSKRKDVPTMGGVMILAGIIVSLLFWADLGHGYMLLGIVSMLALGGLGFVDDWIKLTRSAWRPLKKKVKLAVQVVMGLGIGYLFTRYGFGQGEGTRLCDPVTGFSTPALGGYYILWVAFVIVASSNAVNLTDGIDGLAGGCMAIAAAIFCVLGMLASGAGGIQHSFAMAGVQGGAELCVLSAAVLGSVLGFLWYNSHPAQIFMGDTGSQALGGLLGFIGLALKLDSLLFLVGAVFFLDELTVALQIVSYKLTRRRIFPITPIHHYFQLRLKWPDEKITARFWILAALAGFISVMLLKVKVGL